MVKTFFVSFCLRNAFASIFVLKQNFIFLFKKTDFLQFLFLIIETLFLCQCELSHHNWNRLSILQIKDNWEKKFSSSKDEDFYKKVLLRIKFQNFDISKRIFFYKLLFYQYSLIRTHFLFLLKVFFILLLSYQQF